MLQYSPGRAWQLNLFGSMPRWPLVHQPHRQNTTAEPLILDNYLDIGDLCHADAPQKARAAGEQGNAEASDESNSDEYAAVRSPGCVTRTRIVGEEPASKSEPSGSMLISQGVAHSKFRYVVRRYVGTSRRY
jgi:hypothetical protein